ncbi:TPA: hypothetical protein HL426_20190 [Escherichia coli]|nr:hypothetical protein [Escherichia coli]
MTTRAATAAFFTGPPGGVVCHGAGAARKKASFCIFIRHHHLHIVLNFKYFYFWYVDFACFMLNI